MIDTTTYKKNHYWQVRCCQTYVRQTLSSVSSLVKKPLKDEISAKMWFQFDWDQGHFEQSTAISFLTFIGCQMDLLLKVVEITGKWNPSKESMYQNRPKELLSTLEYRQCLLWSFQRCCGNWWSLLSNAHMYVDNY